MSAIDDKYAQLGGVQGLLGPPANDETPTPGGKGTFRHFQNGSIYWSPETGAHEVHGDIRALWARFGWEQSHLGFPLTDETPTPDGAGRFNDFQGGSIYWTPQGGAHEVKKSVGDKVQSAFNQKLARADIASPKIKAAHLKDIVAAPVFRQPPPAVEQALVKDKAVPSEAAPVGWGWSGKATLHPSVIVQGLAEQAANTSPVAAGAAGAVQFGISPGLAAQLIAEAKREKEKDSAQARDFLSPAQHAALYLGAPELAYALNPDSVTQIKRLTSKGAKVAVGANRANGPGDWAAAVDLVWPLPAPGDTSGSLTGRDRIEGGATAAALRKVFMGDVVLRRRDGGGPEDRVGDPGNRGSGSSDTNSIQFPDNIAGLILPQSVMDPNYRLAKVAIALSGGGAKGDFEVGALRYIYDNQLGDGRLGVPPRPDIVTGTSVGAINGTKIAEGYDDSLAQLESIWRELRYNGDMYLPTLNLDELLGPLLASAGSALTGVALSALLTGGVPLSPLLMFSAAVGISSVADEFRRVLQRFSETRSIFNISPIRRRLDQYSPYWSATGPGLRGTSLAVGHERSGRTLVIARGQDDGCYVCVRTSAPEAATPAFSPWVLLGRRIDSDPALLTDGEGFAVAVIARKPDDGRFHELRIRGDASRRDGWDSSWTPHGYPTREQFEALGVGGDAVRWTTAPTLGSGSSWVDGFIFARGTDNFPYSQSFNRAHGRWEPFRVMGWPLPIASEVSFGRSSDNWKFAFARRASRQIVYCPAAPTDDRWMRWEPFGVGETAGDITAATNGDGRLHVFVVGNDSAVFVRSQGAARGNNWGGWDRIGGIATSTPAAARGLDETLNVFVRGLDYAIWRKSAESSAGGFTPDESGWHSLGTPERVHFLSDPVVVRRPDGMLEVYAVGNDKAVYVNAQVNRAGTVAFAGWHSLGGAVWTGIELRLAAVSVETGELRHVDESGRFAEYVEPLVGVPDGVMASASIPAIFPAVEMNGQAWVDGGVRSITPIKAAVDAGAQVVYAICCSPAVLSPDVHVPLLAPLGPGGFTRVPRSWSEAGLVEVGMRATMQMLTTSIQQSELTPSNPWPVPVYVIQPSFDLHDALTINPALIRIAHGYGWMRAYEATTLSAPSEAMQSSDAIIRARRNIYVREGSFNVRRLAATSSAHAPGVWGVPEEGVNPDSPETLSNCDSAARSAISFDLEEVRRLKRELAALIDARRARHYELPPDSESWITGWETPTLSANYPNGPFGEVVIRSRGGAAATAPPAPPR